jgi:hypothetical protein
MTSPAPDSLFIAFQDAVAGRYSLDRELGRGGMGIVYLAREVRLDRLVALKLLPPELSADADLRERFLREARVAARLSHPNIIPIHSVEDVGDFVFFAMSYIDGETLTQRVQGRGPLSASEGARVLREVAWALAYAHGQGVIHRDVKPDNILLEAGSGRALVADFGIASHAEDRASESGRITGTPEFMSPEQALGEPLDARSDLYALGATAFYMYSGRFVFDGRTPMEIIGRRVTETAPPVASLGCPVPRSIALIIDRCLSRDPAHRPANGQVLAEQLGAAMEERRELPAPLRSFLTTARLSGRGTFAGSVGILAATALSASLFGVTAGWTALVASAVLLPVTAWIVAARQVIKDGFDHTDVVSAFRTAALREREERVGVAKATGTERAVRWYAVVVTPAAWAANWALRWNPTMEQYLDMHNRPLLSWFWYNKRNLWQNNDLWLLSEVYLPILVASGALAGAAALALVASRRDVDGAFWSGLWTRRVGRALFAVARKLVGKGNRRVAVTHRATELSLGLAADALYAQLPRATRESLSEMPVVLQRLQTDAQRLRAEIDRLQEALNDAGAAALSDEFAPIRETRDELLARHRDAVTQLETLRLGLLRLHAGAVSVDTVTTHLRLASEVSTHVERLIAARTEIATEFRYPRPEVPSPV